MSNSNDVMVMTEEVKVETQKVEDTVDMVLSMQQETKAKAGVSDQKHVTVSPPEADASDEEEMEEVDYRTLYKQKMLSDKDRNKIEGSVGRSKESVGDFLAKLKDQGIISEFRMVPLGSGYTMDYVADRVQVFVDKVGNVANIRIG